MQNTWTRKKYPDHGSVKKNITAKKLLPQTILINGAARQKKINKSVYCPCQEQNMWQPPIKYKEVSLQQYGKK